MSRASVIETVTTYLQSGLIDHKLSAVRFAPDCFRTVNGWHNGRTGQGIMNNQARMPGLANMRWVVEGGEAVVVWDVLLPGRLQPVIEYFRVGRGLIKEIRIHLPTTRAGGNAIGPPGPWTKTKEPVKRRQGAALATLRAGQRFIKALQDRTLAQASVGDDISITENGRPTVQGRAAFDAWSKTGLAATLKKLRPQRWVVEGDQAVVLYEADVEAAKLLVGALYLRTYQGKVRELYSIYGAGPSPSEIEYFNQWRAANPLTITT